MDNPVALQIVREAIAQGSSLGAGLAREMKSLRFEPFLHQFVLEFALAKCAVLSSRSAQLDDKELAQALQAEIRIFVDHRITRDPTAEAAFEHYLQLAQALDETRDIPGREIGLFFMERFGVLTAALPAANRLFKKRVRPADLAVAASFFGEYCWPLKNGTDAQVFRTSLDGPAEPGW